MHYKPYVALAMGNIVLAQVTTPGAILSPLNSDLPGPVQTPVAVVSASDQASSQGPAEAPFAGPLLDSAQSFADTALPSPGSGRASTPEDECDESDDAELTASNPSSIGDFQYYGCVESGNGFSTFSVISSTTKMSLDFCAASCPTRFFGVYNA
jgi:hypothetical protein